MDTNWNRTSHSNVLKGTALLLAWCCFTAFMLSGVYLLSNNQYLLRQSAYETYEVRNEFSRYVHNVLEYHLLLRSEEAISQAEEDASEVERKLGRYSFIQQRLNENVNFRYEILDPRTGQRWSNLDEAEADQVLSEQPLRMENNLWLSGNTTIYSEHQYGVARMLESHPVAIRAALMDPVESGDWFFAYARAFAANRQMTVFAASLCGTALLLLIGCIIYLLAVAGRREVAGPLRLMAIDRLYTDVHSFLVFMAAIISGLFFFRINGIHDPMNNTEFWIAFGILCFVDAAIGSSWVLSLARLAKSGRLFSHSLLGTLWRGVSELARMVFHGGGFWLAAIFTMTGYVTGNAILCLLFANAWRYGSRMELLLVFMLLGSFNLLVLAMLLRWLRALSRIMAAARATASGQLNRMSDPGPMPAAFAGFADDFRNLQDGLHRAVDEAVRGERMRAELITNVSHDLKTPLTAIISYVDLLGKEDLQNDRATGYIRVLEEKAARLKQLVTDLVDASKASSGNLAVSPETLDLVQLAQQVCGEFASRLQDADLDLRMPAEAGSLPVWADGAHLWRLLENLMSNVVKYAQPGTRVYLTLDREEGFGRLTLRNISARPLEVSADRLTERFVRGDEARSTDGSGLGLSIAESLAHLMGGRLAIHVDGDLFKVTVDIPLSEVPVQSVAVVATGDPV